MEKSGSGPFHHCQRREKHSLISGNFKIFHSSQFHNPSTVLTMLITIKEPGGAFEIVTKALIVEFTAKISPARCSIIFPSLLDCNKRSIYNRPDIGSHLHIVDIGRSQQCHFFVAPDNPH